MVLGIPEASGEALYTTTLPAPVGGWNAKDPLSRMPPEDAIELENWFPQTTHLEIRKGYRMHSKVTGATSFGNILTLAELSLQNGTKKLIAILIDTTVVTFFDATSTPATDIQTGSGFTFNTAVWSSVNFRNRIFFANWHSSDDVVDWNGVTVQVTKPAFTGPGGDDKLLCFVTSYNDRLIFIEKNSFKIWYGAADAITGALTSFDFQSRFKLGGKLIFCGSTTGQDISNPQTLFALISDQGEIVVYVGDSPASATWAQIGHYFIPPSLFDSTNGSRSFFYLGANLFIITKRGVIGMPEIISNAEIFGKYNAITDKIENNFTTAAYAATTNSPLWTGINNPFGKYILIAAVTTAGVTSQFVMNAITGSWCKFTILNAYSFCVYDGRAYFGSNYGKIMKMDEGTFDENPATDGAAIDMNVKARQAYNYLGDLSRKKLIRFLQPVLKQDQGLFFDIGVNLDYEDTAIANNVTDTTDLTFKFYQPLIKVVGLGRAISIRNDNGFGSKQVEWHATTIFYEKGGVR